MRHLVACPDCQRQYDATGKPVASRFHCWCGSVLTVPRPEVHDAAVVRCSACGGPRQEGAAACGFCRASFTLIERDLNTICPRCLARVSDRGRYCHHCATAILPEGDAGQATEHRCPACGDGSRLRSRQLGETTLSMLECDRCAGLWLGNEVFRHLEGQAVDKRLPLSLGKPGAGSADAPGPAPQTGRFYRPCVVCGKLMVRQNYGKKSGVVIDHCKEHGVWFDDRELAQLLAWVREGGLELARLREDEERRYQDAAARNRRAALDGSGAWTPEPPVGATLFLRALGRALRSVL